MYGNGGGNGMYGGVFCWVIVVFARYCCSKGGNVCIVVSLFLGVGLVGLPDIFLPDVLKLLVVSIVTEIACLAFLVFFVVWSFAYVLGCTFG